MLPSPSTAAAAAAAADVAKKKRKSAASHGVNGARRRQQHQHRAASGESSTSPPPTRGATAATPGPQQAGRYRSGVSSPSPSPSPMLSRRKSNQHQPKDQRRQSQRSPSSGSSSSAAKSPGLSNRKVPCGGGGGGGVSGAAKPSKLPVQVSPQRGAVAPSHRHNNKRKPPLAPFPMRGQQHRSDDDPPPLPPPPPWDKEEGHARGAKKAKRKRATVSTDDDDDNEEGEKGLCGDLRGDGGDRFEAARGSDAESNLAGKRRRREVDWDEGWGELPRVILLERSGESFLVAEVDRSRRGRFKVDIRSQSCTCDAGSASRCHHRSFVMGHVLGVWENDPALSSGLLSTEQVEQLLSDFEKKTGPASLHTEDETTGDAAGLVTSKEQSFNEYGETRASIGEKARGAHNSACRHSGARGETCAICFRTGLAGGSLKACQCCPAEFHQRCIRFWASECLGAGTGKESEGIIMCPRCLGERAATPSESLPSLQNRKLSFPDDDGRGSTGNAATIAETSYASDGPSSTLWEELESGGDCAEIPLSHAESVSQKDWAVANAWMPLLGRDLATSLLSKDWQAREAGLRRLARELANTLTARDSPDNFPDRLWRCVGEVLEHLVRDKVLKVYVSAIRCLRTLLVFTNAVDLSEENMHLIRITMRGLVQSLLVRCADGNRRLAEMSCVAVMEICKGDGGAMALGAAFGDADSAASANLLGLDFVLQVLLEEHRMQWSSQWQSAMGRLTIADRILREMEGCFVLSSQHGAEIVKFTAEYQRLLAMAEFSSVHLGSAHANAARLARGVFCAAALLALANPEAFAVVWEILSAVENKTLQSRMKRKIKAAIARQRSSSCGSNMDSSGYATATPEQYMLVDKLCAQDPTLHEDLALSSSSACSSPVAARLLSLKAARRCSGAGGGGGGGSQWRLNQQHPQLNRSISHSPSRRCLSSDRSTSHSPARAMSKSQSGIFKPPPPAPQRPNFLPLRKTASPFSSPTEDRKLRQPPFRGASSSSFDRDDAAMDLDTQRHHPPPHLTRVLSPPPPAESPLPFVPALFAACCRQFELGVYDEGERTPSPHPSSPTSKTVANSPADDDRRHDAPFKVFGQSQITHMDETITLGVSSSSSSGDRLCGGWSGGRHRGEDCSLETSGYEEGAHWGKGLLLGTGAYSTCYQARDIETGTLMAVKQISLVRLSAGGKKSSYGNNNNNINNGNASADGDAANANPKDGGSKGKTQEKLMRQEVRLLAGLSHPNIVRFFGAVKEESTLNIFVEWMAGGSVAAMLDRHGPFCDAVIARYLSQILSGLEYLHANGILHRDLKGANLLLDSTGQHLRIADFGAAARMAAENSLSGEFKGQLQGTIAFMAPEVLRGESYGRSCDVWSLGCCLIEMATARPPWNAPDVSNHLALIFKIACSSRPPPVPAWLSPALSDLASLCLRRRPADRPTARQLRAHAAFADVAGDAETPAEE